MIIKEQICKAFCNGISIKDVPMGKVITTSANWLSGDRIVFYARERGSLVSFEDSGSTLFDLETSGVDLSSTTRKAILNSLCDEYRIDFDEDSQEFRSGFVNADQAGLAAIRFFYFMLRVQDLLFTARERVSSVFKEDVVTTIKRVFGNSAIVEVDKPPVATLEYYTVDIVVTNKSNGKKAAIFPGTGEQKALEAVLFSKEMELKSVKNVVPFLVYENTGSKISKKTQSKALNSDLVIADWRGNGDEATNKIWRILQAA